MRWSRAQLVAIVAEYWRKGWCAEDVAEKLGRSVGEVRSIFGHVAWTEEAEQLLEEGDDVDQEVPEDDLRAGAGL